MGLGIRILSQVEVSEGSVSQKKKSKKKTRFLKAPQPLCGSFSSIFR